MRKPLTLKEKQQGHRDRADTGTIVSPRYSLNLLLRDGIPSGTRVTSAGLVIEAGATLTQPVSSLTKMQYLRKLATERRRVRKELAKLGETLENPKRCPVCGKLFAQFKGTAHTRMACQADKRRRAEIALLAKRQHDIKRRAKSAQVV